MLDSVPLYQLLLQLTTVSYRKANALNAASVAEKIDKERVKVTTTDKMVLAELRPPLAKYEPELEDSDEEEEEPILG